MPLETRPDPAPDLPVRPEYEDREDLTEFDLQTGKDGQLNQDLQLGIPEGLMDYTEGAFNRGGYNTDYGRVDATGREVQQEELSAYQLEQMLASDSPLMRRAAASAMAGAGGRGLMNSSIAIGNAQGEMIDRAQPFALQDAGTYGQTASEVMAAKNAAAIEEARNRTQAGVTDTQAKAQADQLIYGGRRDVLQHFLGMETREDQQEWEYIQRRYQREHETATNEFNKAWTSGDNREQRLNDWYISEAKNWSARDISKTQAIAQILSSIYNNPELTGAEQNAAAANARLVVGRWWDDNHEPAYGTPTWLEETTDEALMDTGMNTAPKTDSQTTADNAAAGQIVTSASNPMAESVTSSTPPV